METKEPHHECIGFLNCSCNACPLDPLTESMGRKRLIGEKKCVAHKPTRFKIGNKYHNLLPHRGLTKQEWLGENMGQAERDAQR